VIRSVWLILETLGSLLASGCLLRFWLIAIGNGLRDPVGHFVQAATDWLIRPLRAIVPPHPRLEWASLLAALLVSVLLAAAYVVLLIDRAPSFGAVVLLALGWLGKWALWLLIFVLILQAVLSWVNPSAPIAPLLDRLTEPLLAPLRRRLPRVGGVDLSPLVVILLAQVVLSLMRDLNPLL
jgi:YggT family protein